MRILTTLLIGVVLFSFLVSSTNAQAPITSVTLGPDQIGLVRLAPAITTRISFPEAVAEVICGDLYDPASGKGTFVVQRSDSDVYLKPVAPNGSSNLFVKTGKAGEHVYNFDLSVVGMQQANRVIHVKQVSPTAGSTQNAQEKRSSTIGSNQTTQNAAATATAEEILRAARDQAMQIVADAEQKAKESERLADDRAQKQAGDFFLRGLLSGLREIKLSSTRIANKKFAVVLEPTVLIFNDRAHLRLTIQNTSDSELMYGTLTLENIVDGINKSVPVELVQSKDQNTLKPNESVGCVLIFDANSIGPKDRLTLNIRGDGNTELARVRIN